MEPSDAQVKRVAALILADEQRDRKQPSRSTRRREVELMLSMQDNADEFEAVRRVIENPEIPEPVRTTIRACSLMIRRGRRVVLDRSLPLHERDAVLQLMHRSLEQVRVALNDTTKPQRSTNHDC